MTIDWMLVIELFPRKSMQWTWAMTTPKEPIETPDCVIAVIASDNNSINQDPDRGNAEGDEGPALYSSLISSSEVIKQDKANHKLTGNHYRQRTSSGGSGKLRQSKLKKSKRQTPFEKSKNSLSFNSLYSASLPQPVSPNPAERSMASEAYKLVSSNSSTAIRTSPLPCSLSLMQWREDAAKIIGWMMDGMHNLEGAGTFGLLSMQLIFIRLFTMSVENWLVLLFELLYKFVTSLYGDKILYLLFAI